MAEVRLLRTGQAPLQFAGELLAESKGKWHKGQDQNRYHDLSIYRTAAGTYVVGVAYRTCWQGEDDWDFADTTTAAASVERLLRDAIELSLGRAIGYPPSPAYGDRQARMLASLRERYEGQVSAVLEQHDDFAQRID